MLGRYLFVYICISNLFILQEPDKEVIKMMENIGYNDINVECKDLAYLFDNLDDFKSKTHFNRLQKRRRSRNSIVYIFVRTLVRNARTQCSQASIK